jgi:hypothetical protein
MSASHQTTPIGLRLRSPGQILVQPSSGCGPSFFEDAPRPVHWFLLLGWRRVLGLRLGPRPSPDHILGWRIASRQPEEVRLELHSALMVAQLTLHLASSTAFWSTNVCYTRPLARPLWAAVGMIHRRMVPSLLGRAASFPRPATLFSTN